MKGVTMDMHPDKSPEAGCLIDKLADDFASSFALTREDGNRLRDFIHFLDHRHQDPGLVSYGLLVQSNQKEDLDDFAGVLEQILAQADSLKEYQLYSVSESNVSKVDWKPYSDSHIILVLKDCTTSGSVRPILSAFAEIPKVVKIVFAPPRIVNERFSRNQEFMQDIVPRKVLLRELGPAEVKNRARQMFLREYKPSAEFLEDLGYYVEAEYPRRDVSCADFLRELWTQVAWAIQEKTGVAAYRNGRELEASLLPESTYAAERKRRAAAKSQSSPAKPGAEADAEKRMNSTAEAGAEDQINSGTEAGTGNPVKPAAEPGPEEEKALRKSAPPALPLDGYLINRLHLLDTSLAAGKQADILQALNDVRYELARFPEIWQKVSVRDVCSYYRKLHPSKKEKHFLSLLHISSLPDSSLLDFISKAQPAAPEKPVPEASPSGLFSYMAQLLGDEDWTKTAVHFVKEYFRTPKTDGTPAAEPADAVLLLSDALEKEKKDDR